MDNKTQIQLNPGEVLLTEPEIVNRVVDYLLNKEHGQWHPEKVDKANLHEHGVDIKMVGGKRNSEYFYIECKGKSYAKKDTSRRANNRECWLGALGQLITRIDVKPGTYRYGMGLYWESAQVALRRIPKAIAEKLRFYIYSVYDDGTVKEFTPSKFGIEYPDEVFK